MAHRLQHHHPQQHRTSRFGQQIADVRCAGPVEQRNRQRWRPALGRDLNRRAIVRGLRHLYGEARCLDLGLCADRSAVVGSEVAVVGELVLDRVCPPPQAHGASKRIGLPRRHTCGKRADVAPLVRDRRSNDCLFKFCDCRALLESAPGRRQVAPRKKEVGLACGCHSQQYGVAGDHSHTVLS